MKLTELMKVSGSQTGSVSWSDLLLKSIFGDKIPSMFIPGAKYEVGDRVYVKEDDGDIAVYECIKEGIYDKINSDGWKEFDVQNGNMILATWAAEFLPGGYYFEGDVVYVTSEDGTIAIYVCEEEGRYHTLTNGGWKNLGGGAESGEVLNRDLIEQILKNIYGAGSTPVEFEPNKYYEEGDVVYIVDDNGIIHIKECVVSGNYTDTNNDGWVSSDTTNLNGGGITLATHQDIIDMFNSNKIPGIDIDILSGDITIDDEILDDEIEGGGGGNCNCNNDYATNKEIEDMFNGVIDPWDNVHGDGDVIIESDWPDANQDGSPDTLWNEF